MQPECASTPRVTGRSGLTPLLLLVRQPTGMSVVPRPVAKAGRPSTMNAFFCFMATAPEWSLKLVPPVKTLWVVSFGSGDTNPFLDDSPLD